MKKFDEIVNLQDTCVAYGSFDGMHKGHLKVVKEVVAQADKKNLIPVILSCPADKQVLTTEREKEYFLKDTGVDVLMSCKAGTDMLKTAIETLSAKVLVIGENHKDIETVKATAEKAGVEVVVCESESCDGEIITTEAVKKAFDACDFEKVTKLCGHAYVMIGEVMHGKALGRTVGMPTANLGAPDCKLKPPSGVYATSVAVDDEVFKAMTNIGKRPSVDDFDYVTIEAFILDFSRDIYGKEIVLEVYKFVRGVIKFASLEDVQKQVQKDIQTVRDTLNL